MCNLPAAGRFRIEAQEVWGKIRFFEAMVLKYLVAGLFLTKKLEANMQAPCL